MTQKVFINAENKATFICPACNKTKITDVSKYKNATVAVKVKCKCPCGHAYNAILERRKSVRKNLNLAGTFTTEGGKNKGNLTVLNLSRTGMKLKLNFHIDLQVGEKILVEFSLDDQERSSIRKDVFIRSIKDRILGTEFVAKEHYDKLGTYLLYSFD